MSNVAISSTCQVCANPSDKAAMYTRSDGSKYPVVVCSRQCQRYIGADGSVRSIALNDQPRPIMRSVLRQLWQEHVSYTREVIMATFNATKSVTTQSGDKPPSLERARVSSVERLLKNQDDIGSVLGAALSSPFTGETLSRYLRGHIVGAAKILGQAVTTSGLSTERALTLLGNDKTIRPSALQPATSDLSSDQVIDGSGTSATLKAAIEQWYDNGAAIVELLLGVLPSLERQTLEPAFNTHLYQTIVEAVHYLNGEYDQSIKTADAATDHMLVVSDVLLAAVISAIEATNGNLNEAAQRAQQVFKRSRQ